MADQKISDMTSASSVADADIVPIVQSASNKKSALSVVKTYLTTAFNALYVPLTRTLTINGDTKDLSANRSWTITAGTGDVVGPGSATDNAVARFDSTTGKLIQNSALTLADDGEVAWPNGVRQTFNPDGTTPGLNVGAISGDPNTPSNGDMWYDSMADELTARVNGVNKTLGSGTVTNVAPLTTGQLVVGASGSTVNVGNLSGDVTTSGGTAATLAAGNAGNLNSGTLLAARMPALTGDVTTSAGAVATTIANDVVTYAKIQNVSAASKLLGRGDSGSGDTQEITLGTNLAMSGTTLNASGGGSGITNIATTSPITGGPITTTGTIALNVGVDHAFTAAQSITGSDADTNGVLNVFSVGHNSSATPLANFGTGMVFKAEDSTTADVSAGEIQTLWTTPTHNSNVSKMTFRLLNGGLSMTTAGSLTGAGIMDVNSGYSVGAAAASGAILQGDGTKFRATTFTWPTAVSTSGKVIQSNGTNLVMSTPTFPTAAGTSGNVITSDGTNFASTAPNTVFKLADGQALTSTSLIDITGLTFSLVAGTYLFNAVLHGQVTSGTAGVQMGINYTGTYTSGDYQASGMASGTTNAQGVRGTANNTATGTFLTTATAEAFTQIAGRIVTGGAGTFSIRALKLTSQTFTVRASSYAIVTKVA